MPIIDHAKPAFLALSCVGFIAWGGSVHAQDAAPAPEGRRLGGVTVVGTPIDDETQKSYKISRSLTATKTDTPLVDVPQSVNVVSVKQIEDQAANSIGDAIRYVPGVFSSQGEGNRETLVFRGNSTTGDFFVDGVRDDVQTYRDLYNIERLEVFRGPNAMIFGRGGVGGVINRVTKVADGQRILGARLEGGSFAHKRAQIDLGAPLSDAVSVRITGVYQDSGSYRHGVDYTRWGLNPTLTFTPGPDTTITLGYEHFKDERVADRGVSSYLGKPLRTPRGRFFGDPRNSPTWTNSDAATLFIEHRFSDRVSIRNRTRYADYDKFYQNLFAGSVNASPLTNDAVATKAPGLPLGTYAPGTIVQIQAYNNAMKRRNLINQTDFNAVFDTGSIQHTLLVGAEFGRQKTENVRNEGFFPTTGPGILTDPTTIYALIDRPTIRRPDVHWAQISTSGDNRGTATVAAGYIQDQIAISPMFQIILGVRYEHFRTKVTDRRTVGFPVNQQRHFDVTNNLWSPRAGILFKPAENATIYASYSRTYLPRGGDQLNSLSITNQNLVPEKYQNYEIGAKWDINPSFNVTAAIFRLDRTNMLISSDPNNASAPTIPVGKTRTKGFELSAAGEVTRRLSVVAAYTYSDGKFLDTVSGTVAKGNALPNVPKHSGSLWVRYDPLDRVGAAVGVIHLGKRYAATDNAVVLPGFTRVDAALYFRINDQLDAQLNVENLLNKRYFIFANSNTNITPGSPTAFKAGLNARF